MITCCTKRAHFDYFKSFLVRKRKNITYISDVKKRVCQEYISFMKNEKVKYDDHKAIDSDEQGLKPSTINIRISSLKAQFNFYEEEGYIEKSPWSGIKKLKVDEGKIKFLSKF